MTYFSHIVENLTCRHSVEMECMGNFFFSPFFLHLYIFQDINELKMVFSHIWKEKEKQDLQYQAE